MPQCLREFELLISDRERVMKSLPFALHYEFFVLHSHHVMKVFPAHHRRAHSLPPRREQHVAIHLTHVSGRGEGRQVPSGWNGDLDGMAFTSDVAITIDFKFEASERLVLAQPVPPSNPFTARALVGRVFAHITRKCGEIFSA